MAAAERDVRNWVKALGGLCAGALPQREAEAKASAYAPLLAAEFGAECFTPASLASVARACKFFPSFGEVAAALSAWWQENPSVQAARLAGPVWEQSTDEAAHEAQTRRDWQDTGNIRRSVSLLDGHPQRLALGGMLAGAVERYAPENLDHLPPEFIARLQAMRAN